MYLVYRGSLEEKEYVPKLDGLGSPVCIAAFSTRNLAVEYALARSFPTVVIERNVSIQGGDTNNLFSECEYEKSIIPPEPEPLPEIGGTVSLDGNIQVGETLTVNSSQLIGGGPIQCKWYRADSMIDPFVEIMGGTGDIHILTAEDADKYIQVAVTMTGYTGEIVSPAVGPIIL